MENKHEYDVDANIWMPRDTHGTAVHYFLTINTVFQKTKKMHKENSTHTVFLFYINTFFGHIIVFSRRLSENFNFSPS